MDRDVCTQRHEDSIKLSSRSERFRLSRRRRRRLPIIPLCVSVKDAFVGLVLVTLQLCPRRSNSLELLCDETDIKGRLGHKACKSHRDYSAFPSSSGSCSLLSLCSCILSYLLTNIPSEFLSLVTNTEPNDSAFVYKDVDLYLTTSFLLPVSVFLYSWYLLYRVFKHTY